MSDIVNPLVNLISNNASYTKDQLVERIQAITGNVLGNSTISRILANDASFFSTTIITKASELMTSNTPPTVTASNGDTSSATTTSLSPDAQTSASLVNSISQDNNALVITDKEAALSFLAAIAASASKQGISNAIGLIAGSIPDGNDVKVYASKVLLAAQSDTGYDVNLLTEVNTLINPVAVNALIPDVVNIFATRYTNRSAPKTDPAEIYSNLLASLESLDPNWRTVFRLDTEENVLDASINVVPTVNGSDDYRKVVIPGVLRSDSVVDKMQIIATLFPPTTTRAEISKAFPDIVSRKRLNTIHKVI